MYVFRCVHILRIRTLNVVSQLPQRTYQLRNHTSTAHAHDSERSQERRTLNIVSTRLEINTNQTYNCQRDQLLSASQEQIQSSSEAPQNHDTKASRGSMGGSPVKFPFCREAQAFRTADISILSLGFHELNTVVNITYLKIVYTIHYLH